MNNHSFLNRPLANTKPFNRRVALFFLCCVSAILLSACGEHAASKTDISAASSAPMIPNAAAEGERIIQQNRALDNSRDRWVKMAVKIEEADGQTQNVQLEISRKRESDNQRMMLINFTAPAEERDRSALIIVSPQGEIEGIRYMQSSNSFVTAKGATNEDSLFGLTAQEMIDGQTEKYSFRLLGEETLDATPVYKLEGTLKPGAESKFARLVTWVDKSNYTTLAAEFYNNKNELQRRVSITKNEQVNGHWTQMHYAIDNLARKKKLDLEIKEVRYDQNLSPQIFTRENLKKLTMK
ncbi:MAG: outer membrane lipoprotein-sorting protein [Acidobacteriota bacterium]